jgi:hypothetical protein
LNVAAAAPAPTAPVADGSTAVAGQTATGGAGEATTGFDALLALVAGLAAPGDGETAPDKAGEALPPAQEAEAAPTDSTLAVLAALMTPPPAAPLTQTTVETPPGAPSTPPPAAAPTAPSVDAAPVGPQPAPVADAAAFDMAAALDADAVPAPAPTAAKGETAPAPIALATAQAAPAAAKIETPVRAAEPAQPTARTAAAPAEAVRTETDQAVTAMSAAGDQGAPSGSGSKTASGAAAEPAAPAATNPSLNAAAPVEPIRTAAATTPAAPPAPVRGSPETVAKLSADILKKLDGRSTRFELALDPAGLGRVDVKVEIGAHGHVTAALSFDTPQAAAELRNRAGELRSALQQAGFDLPENALSFDVGGQAGGDGRGAQTAWDYEGRDQRGSAFAGRAFQAVLNGGESLAADLSLRLGAARADGVDIRI